MITKALIHNRSIVSHQQRHLFFMGRLLNKPTKSQGFETTATYDDVTYLRAMKQFQKETRAILPDSAEYKDVRNGIYREMRLKKG